MKKLFSLFLCLVLLSPVAYGQSRKSTKKTSKPQTTVKKQSAAPEAKQAAKVNPVRVFEGTLVYASLEYHSAAVRRYSSGQAYNGTRELCITISGNKIHIVDKNLCIHTIMDADANMCYIYSEATKSGVSYPLTDYRGLYSQLANDSKLNKLTWATPGKTIYKGDELETYHASITAKTEGVNNTGTVELWSSKAFKVGEIMNAAFYGADLHGLVKKWVYESKGSVPIIGTMHSIVSSELVALSEYKVDQSVFVVPEDITIVPDKADAPFKMLKMYKAHKKALKKLGLTPVDSAEETLPQIQNDWAFVQAVENDEQYTGSIAKAVWGEIGTAVISSAASLYQEEKERWEQERIEEKMQREMYEEEQQRMTAASRPVAQPSRPGKGKKQGVTRVREVRDGVTTCTDPYLMSESYIKWMRTLHVAPGTEFDPTIHRKCIECHKFPTGRCTACGGMGFYKKYFANVVDEDGTTHPGTADVPMKGVTRDCSACGGNRVCHICGGSGKSAAEYMSGSGIKKSCSSCRGTKKCKFCHGMGSKTYYTPDASGQGDIVDESTQSTRKSVEKQVDCVQCNKTGNCQSCQGTKVFTYAGVSRPCEMCNRTGKCKVCNGRKTVSVTARE